MRHLLNPLDSSVEEIDQLLDLAVDIEYNLPRYAHACDGKRIVILFYEPGAQTRSSLEPAMLSLDRSVPGFSSTASSLAVRGGSMSDTIRMISCYADICVMHHPKEGALLVASAHSFIPVTNAGDGGHQHPIQTLTDLMTTRPFQGRLDDMTVDLCGDLEFGRTVHSLVSALVHHPGIKFVLISPPKLWVPEYVREDVLAASSIEFEEVDNLDEAMSELDILYTARVQEEHFFNGEDYIRLKDCYILDNTKTRLAKGKMSVLRPLLRVSEISVEVDDDPRTTYFRQV